MNLRGQWMKYLFYDLNRCLSNYCDGLEASTERTDYLLTKGESLMRDL